ncbi:ferritin-like domain-containing protein [Croceibacterium ferulae]|uniref:ferritin-like domain-containing protein n=1 Tax=Croceibacterium ferulae TaxID=1854641 RepID=UPI000EAF0B90|nr:ferritin-like domain-containing protein [Croceibacterium ferulae]
MTGSLSAAIAGALLTGEPQAKAMRVRALVRAWRTGALAWDWATPMPDRPALPPGLQLLSPAQMPRRRGGSEASRIALWHSLAHIEFVAIDLALDAAGRFGEAQGPEFVDDFLSVAADEAMHWALIARKLRTAGSHYGALPAHDGLWEAAEATRRDVAARLAVVPMVLEARGLDVNPAMHDRVLTSGDQHGARILRRLLDDEIRHVAAGAKHFAQVAASRGESYENYWEILVRQYCHGTLKPPFNDSARQAAGLPRSVYTALA